MYFGEMRGPGCDTDLRCSCQDLFNEIQFSVSTKNLMASERADCSVSDLKVKIKSLTCSFEGEKIN